jgi:hypothetical protein
MVTRSALKQYADDMAIAMKDPKTLISTIASAPNRFKLKGSGPIKFHLGMEFLRDRHGVH